MNGIEPVPRSRVLVAGILLEGGLGALAVAVGLAIGRDPLETVAWEARGAVAGVAAAGPLMLVLAASMRSQWGPFARLRAFFDEVARPALADCTVADLAALSAAAGIGEELLFRGLIQGGLADALGPGAGLAIASVLFGLAHPISTTYVVVAGLMGAYLGAVWVASGNLFVPIVAHAFYDFVALVWLVKMRGPGGESPSTDDSAPGASAAHRAPRLAGRASTCDAGLAPDRTGTPTFAPPETRGSPPMSVAAQPTTETPPSPAPLSAAVLLARGLTPGKLRGLSRISQPDGTLCILALDQNASMITMAREALHRRGEGREPSYDEIVDAKLDLARQIAPAASGVLIDGFYGAWPAVASGAVPPDRGMLVRLEKSGAPKTPAGVPLTMVEPGWSVEKIKLMGADALKLLLPFDPTESESAEKQLATLEEVAGLCRRHDLLFLLEPISVPIRGETKTDARYLDRKPSTVIESARLLSRYADIYKSEFPGTLGRESDDQLHDNLQALGAATERPWVLLSAGVDFDQYRRQVEMALEFGGASGTLGGRAYWKEYFHQDAPEARTEFAATTGRSRVAEVAAMVRASGTPWFERYGLSAADFPAIRPAEGWNARYAPHAAAAGDDGRAARPGDVY